jgi:predicted  nucleic acid-binding Zn-ribbon protein
MDQTVLLTKLQDLDLEIVRGRKKLDELPEKTTVLELRRRLKEIEALRVRAQAQVDAADADVRKAEDEAALLQGKIDAEQAKMMSGEVTNPKEVQNLSRELASLGRHKEKLDTDTLDLMEKRETAAAQVAKVDAALVEGAQREKVAVARFQERGGEVSADLGRLEAERKVVAAAVEPELLQRYETLRQQKHGIGLGVLRDEGCSACRVSLPADKVEKLHGGPPIATCPNCHRILIVTGPKDEQ